MLRRTLLVLILVTGPTEANAEKPAKQFPWNTDYNAVRLEAADKHKPILVLFTMDPDFVLGRMEKEVFDNPMLREFVAQHFVCLKVDMAKEQHLTKALRIDRVPTWVLAGPDGKIHLLEVGYQDAAGFRENLQSVIEKINEEKRIRWHTDAARARKDAAAKKLSLMLYFTFEECYHAKRFEKITLRDPAILDTLDKNFLCVKIDVKSQEALAKKYGVTGCPAMVFLGPDGKHLHRVEGYQEAAAFAKHLQHASGVDK
jgi:thioredoxin-related protein